MSNRNKIILLLIVTTGALLRSYFIFTTKMVHEDSCSTLAKVTLHYSEIKNIENVNWILKDEIRKKYFRLDEKSLAYQDLLRQLKTSNHPPLYYIIYHTLIVIFPEKAAVSVGYIFNLLLWIFGCFIFFKILELLFQNQRIALIGLAMYSLSTSMISTTLLLKGYALQEVLFLLTTYLVIRKLDQTNLPVLHYIKFSALCLLSFLTHYYSYFLIAALSLIIFLFFIGRKEQRSKILFYGLSVIIAIGLAIIIYPNVISDLQGDVRSVEIRNNLESPGFLNSITTNIQFLLLQFFDRIHLVLIGLGLILLAVSKGQLKMFRPGRIIIMASVGVLLYFFIMTISKFEAIRYVSSAFPLLILIPAYFFKSVSINSKLFNIVLILLCVAPLGKVCLYDVNTSTLMSPIQNYYPVNQLEFEPNDAVMLVHKYDTPDMRRFLLFNYEGGMFKMKKRILNISQTKVNPGYQPYVLIDERLKARMDEYSKKLEENGFSLHDTRDDFVVFKSHKFQ